MRAHEAWRLYLKCKARFESDRALLLCMDRAQRHNKKMFSIKHDDEPLQQLDMQPGNIEVVHPR